MARGAKGAARKNAVAGDGANVGYEAKLWQPFVPRIPAFPLLPATPKRAAWRLVLGQALAYFADSYEQIAAQDREVLESVRKDVSHSQFSGVSSVRSEARPCAERMTNRTFCVLHELCGNM